MRRPGAARLRSGRAVRLESDGAFAIHIRAARGRMLRQARTKELLPRRMHARLLHLELEETHAHQLLELRMDHLLETMHACGRLQVRTIITLVHARAHTVHAHRRLQERTITLHTSATTSLHVGCAPSKDIRACVRRGCRCAGA